MALFKFVFLEVLVEFEPNTEPELSTRESLQPVHHHHPQSLCSHLTTIDSNIPVLQIVAPDYYSLTDCTA